MASFHWSTSDTLSLIGIVVSVAGFGTAIWQIRRTATAAEATNRALVNSARTHMLYLLPQFRYMEADLVSAFREKNVEFAARSLTNYTYAAMEMANIIELNKLGDEDTVNSIRVSTQSAVEAKNLLYIEDSPDLKLLLMPIIAEINNIVQRLTVVGATQNAQLAKGS